MKRVTLLLICSIGLTACMVGPNFHAPKSPTVTRFTETPLPHRTVRSNSPGGNAQVFAKNEEIPLLWWELFHSKEINQLVQAGLANNPSLDAAVASLKQAQEQVNVEIGNAYWPAFKTVNTGQRQRYSLVSIGAANQGFTFNLYNPTLTVSYNLDVFGSSRRQVESLRAQADYQHFELIAAYLTLTSNIVTTAVTMASYQDQIKATVSLIKVEEGVLHILQQQYRLGGISNADLLTQQTTLEQTKASLPPLEKSLAQATHTLSTLVGQFPDAPLPKINLNSLNLPAHIPLSLPSDLVRQRPDVLAAESLLHAACAQIGVATANLLPSFNMTGSYGWINTSLTNLFIPQHVVWSVIGQASQTIFQGGALFANRRAQIAAFEQAKAQYRETVLAAFKNVADSLIAIETDARALRAEAQAEKAAGQALKLTLNQYRLGGSNYINLLNAQRQYQQTKINRIQAQAARFNDTVALFQSLGGGWWKRPSPYGDLSHLSGDQRKGRTS